MQKIDYNREFSQLLIKYINTLELSQNSLLSLLSFIFDNYRFDIKFLFSLKQFADKFKQVELDNEIKFTPSPSGDEEKGNECQ